jgi:chemotaxis response regulator CheB
MKERAAGVILTGTGDDGVDGLGTIMAKGGKIFVQDPRSCLFKETPIKAAAKYTLDYLVSDTQMAGAINSFIRAQRN